MNFSKSLIAVSALAFLASCGQNNTPTTPAATTKTTETQTTTKTETTATATTTEATATPMIVKTDSSTIYSDDVAYTTPAGEVTAKFDLEIDPITNTIIDADAEVVSMPEGDKMSDMKIEDFDKAIENLVKGKKIADIQSLDAVGGASLTTDAFKKFAASIK